MKKITVLSTVLTKIFVHRNNTPAIAIINQIIWAELITHLNQPSVRFSKQGDLRG